MTEKEIIKALEYCTGIKRVDACANCPACVGCNDCVDILREAALDLINRQQAEISVKKKLLDKAEAEIERLKRKCRRLEQYDEERDIRLHARLTETAKNEAIKEFAERLKEKIHNSVYQYWNENSGGYYLAEDVDDDIDTLVQEMTGEQK